MIRFDALFSTVLASSFCAANRNTHTHTTAHTASNPQQIVVHHPANVDHEEVLAGDRVRRRLPELWNVDDQAWRCDDVSMTRSPWTAEMITANRLQRHWQRWRSTTHHGQYRAHRTTNYNKVYTSYGSEVDSGAAMANKPVLAHLLLVSCQQTAWQQVCAELARCRQLRDCLLHGEVAAAQRTTDLTATAGTCRRLVLEASIGQQMWETTGTHQVTVCTLQFTNRPQRYLQAVITIHGITRGTHEQNWYQ